MINIAIIGAGELGGQHLQALSYLDERAIVHVVDPSEKSREIAKERFNQVYQNIRIIFGLMILFMKEQKTSGCFGF